MSFLSKLKDEIKEHAEEIKDIVEEHKELVRLIPGSFSHIIHVNFIQPLLREGGKRTIESRK
jgi:hypothetical protein